MCVLVGGGGVQVQVQVLADPLNIMPYLRHILDMNLCTNHLFLYLEVPCGKILLVNYKYFASMFSIQVYFFCLGKTNMCGLSGHQNP